MGDGEETGRYAGKKDAEKCSDIQPINTLQRNVPPLAPLPPSIYLVVCTVFVIDTMLTLKSSSDEHSQTLAPLGRLLKLPFLATATQSLKLLLHFSHSSSIPASCHTLSYIPLPPCACACSIFWLRTRLS